MNRLNGVTVYLAGAIEHDTNAGSWRDYITKTILKPLGIRAYNPLYKPSFMSPKSRENVANLRLDFNNGNAEAFEVFREIRDIDRRFAYACDFMICYLPKIMTIGTIEELTIASQSNKPVLLVCPDGLISTWLPAMLSNSRKEYYKHIHFTDWNSLDLYLNKLNSNLIEVDKLKWIFLSYFEDPIIKGIYNEIDNTK